VREALTGWLVLAALAGCGARVVVDAATGGGPGGAGAGDASASSTASAGGFSPHPECAAADGVRLCGGPQGQCPPLAAPECPGFGCTPAIDIASLTVSATGVCWADAPLGAAAACTACLDGQVCAQRYDDQLVCVPPEVCEALWDLGASSVCRYADKSAYDHQKLPSPEGPCPAEAPSTLCGGACGACLASERCTGRSPGHPFGICVQINGNANPSPFWECSMDEGGKILTPCPFVKPICGVFDAAAGDLAAARRYGLCFDDADRCLGLAKTLPGGYLCFDEKGQAL
jgi:hypothetical protein